MNLMHTITLRKKGLRGLFLLHGVFSLIIFLTLIGGDLFTATTSQEQEKLLGNHAQSIDTGITIPVGTTLPDLSDLKIEGHSAHLALQVGGLSIPGVEGEASTILERGWSSPQLKLIAGQWPSSPGEVALPERLGFALGETIHVFADRLSLTVVGLVDPTFGRDINTFYTAPGTIESTPNDDGLLNDYQSTLMAFFDVEIPELGKKIFNELHSRGLYSESINPELISSSEFTKGTIAHDHTSNLFNKIPEVTIPILFLPALFSALIIRSTISSLSRTKQEFHALGINFSRIEIRGLLYIATSLLIIQFIAASTAWGLGTLLREPLETLTLRTSHIPRFPLAWFSFSLCATAIPFLFFFLSQKLSFKEKLQHSTGTGWSWKRGKTIAATSGAAFILSLFLTTILDFSLVVLLTSFSPVFLVIAVISFYASLRPTLRPSFTTTGVIQRILFTYRRLIIFGILIISLALAVPLSTMVVESSSVASEQKLLTPAIPENQIRLSQLDGPLPPEAVQKFQSLLGSDAPIPWYNALEPLTVLTKDAGSGSFGVFATDSAADLEKTWDITLDEKTTAALNDGVMIVTNPEHIEASADTPETSTGSVTLSLIDIHNKTSDITVPAISADLGPIGSPSIGGVLLSDYARKLGIDPGTPTLVFPAIDQLANAEKLSTEAGIPAGRVERAFINRPATSHSVMILAIICMALVCVILTVILSRSYARSMAKLHQALPIFGLKRKSILAMELAPALLVTLAAFLIGAGAAIANLYLFVNVMDLSLGSAPLVISIDWTLIALLGITVVLSTATSSLLSSQARKAS